jgi:ketosteroid isomerase-like protein
MDEAETQQLLEELYAATSAGDSERVRPMLDPEFEFQFDSVEAHAYAGVDGFCAAVRDWHDAWEHYQSELEGCVLVDDTAVALMHIRGRGKGSGLDVAADRTDIWKVRDGKFVAFRRFNDHAAALANLAASGCSPEQLEELERAHREQVERVSEG